MLILVTRLYYVALITSLMLTVAVPPLHSLLKHGKLGSGALHVNKSLFTHFYAMGVFACVACWTFRDGIRHIDSQIESGLAKYTFGGAGSTIGASFGGEGRVALFLLFLQVGRRLLECLLIQNWSDSTMHIGHYVVGMSFYLFTSLAVWVDYGLIERMDWEWQREVRIVCGIVMFVLASKVQYESHLILANLRPRKHGMFKILNKTDQRQTDERQYRLPRGGRFSTSLYPHYTAEIFIYLSMFVIAPSLTTLLLLIWTFANLGVSASEGKTWYKAKFGSKIDKLASLLPGVF